MAKVRNDKQEVEWIWQWALHEDVLFQSRCEFAIVVQSVLLTAFAAIPDQTDNALPFRHVIMGLGVFFSLIWLYGSVYQGISTMSPVQAEARALLPFYNQMSERRRHWLPVTYFTGLLAPIIFSLVWGSFACEWPNAPTACSWVLPWLPWG